jgi:hypothetical protein
MRKNLLILSGAALLWSAVVAGANLHAQESSPSSSSSTTQTTTITTEQDETKDFLGKIEKKDDQYVLVNDAAKSSHKLDDATKAEEFDGDDVRVIGSLDSATNMIRVQSIEKVEN